MVRCGLGRTVQSNGGAAHTKSSNCGCCFLHMEVNMYQYILFDLDGTLTDPREGITKSVQYALAKMGIEEPDLTALEHFIGPPLYDEFRRCYDFDDAQAR